MYLFMHTYNIIYGYRSAPCIVFCSSQNRVRTRNNSGQTLTYCFVYAVRKSCCNLVLSILRFHKTDAWLRNYSTYWLISIQFPRYRSPDYKFLILHNSCMVTRLFYVSAHIQLHVRISSFARRLQGPQARLKG